MDNLSAEYVEALKELLFKMADDQLVIGHRYSEWTGIGPVLEEDIAFGSLAQDKVGHSFNLYQLLTALGEADPDELGFKRNEKKMKCCHLVEFPIGEYDYSLMRHFLFDHAEQLRFNMLISSSYAPLANLAKKIRGEIKYHVFHGNTWIKQLSTSSEEAKARMQSALNEAYPQALGIFEEGPFEKVLSSEGIFEGEIFLKMQWQDIVNPLLAAAGLKVPAADGETHFGGRMGYHTEHLSPLLEEMQEVVNTDPASEW